ncbi:hypothetical protein RB595_008894 [Gaeumannomyces hyphopodioides]
MSSTAITSRTAAVRTPVGTPQKAAATSAAVTESPGNWKHPRLGEITRRQNATRFSEKNLRIILYNALAFVMVVVVRSNAAVQKHTQKYSPSIRGYIWWAFLGLHLIPLVNIGLALLPLLRAKDDISDIPLTAAQRQLLGLPPSSAPATPGTGFSTPPRYARTPSFSGSVGSAKSFSTSPLLGKGAGGSPGPLLGSPGNLKVNGSGSASPFSPFSPGGVGGSPLFQKAVKGGQRRGSFGGSPAPLLSEKSLSAAPTLVPDSSAISTGTPSPSGKRTSVALNSKWLYEKGRRSSGSGWAH